MTDKRPIHDEYNWEEYTKEYSAQAERDAASGVGGSDAVVKKSYATKDTIVYKDNLHGNWKNIYSTIRKLRPATVFECGCGGMHHLYNIQKLMPGVKVYGADLLQSQIDWGEKFWGIPPTIKQNVKVANLATDGAHKQFDKYDFVYSQAVVMHLSHDNALRFVKNMVELSNKYVYLCEGDQHDYIELMELIGELNNFELTKISYNSFLFTKV